VSLQQHLQATLPHYMVPSRFLAAEELPLNANGKVDRAELMSEQGQSCPFSQSPVSRRPGDMLALELAQLWADILGVETVMRDDDFFNLGGTSLLAARLVLRVRDVYKIHYPIYALYESGTLRDFIAVVRRAQNGVASLPPGPDGPDTWQADARLPNDIRAAIAESVGRRSAPRHAWWVEGAVFLTGATGFLGAFLLRDLLVTTGTRVHCLVRAANEAEGMTRLREALTKYELWQDRFAVRIHAVPGDLQRRRFGLDAAAFAVLADAVDVVIHSGAQVSYVQPYVAHRATNVGGTAEVLRLAATGRLKPLHHVSTIAVFGPRGYFGGDHCVREDDDLDTNLESLSYDIGYSTSKWVSEKMVWEAEDAGLEVTVHRPGFIMGDSTTGAGNADDFVGRLVRGAIQIGAYPDLPRQRKEFVPVDYVSRSILHIARQADSHGRAYHLVPPDPRESIDLEQFFALVCELGYSLTRESYGEWVERVIEDSRERDNPLCPLVPMLSECVYRDEVTRWELYEGMTYDASNAARVLQDSEIRFHPMDQSLIAKYVGYWIGTGDLPPCRDCHTSTENSGHIVINTIQVF
jgi:thioester reductase-like protein